MTGTFVAQHSCPLAVACYYYYYFAMLEKNSTKNSGLTCK